jgi:hypothetical protein
MRAFIFALGFSCAAAFHSFAAAWLTNSVPANGRVVITWNSRGTLEAADQLGGPWTAVTNSNPYTNQITSSASFFRLNQTVDTTSLHKKVMCGYQGWFRCPGDGTNFWIHWSRDSSQITTNTLTFDLWPDVTEYSNTYPAPGFTYPGGAQAYLFSSQDAQTTDLHFNWLNDYGIDGVFVQRFVVDTTGRPWMTNVLNHVRTAANRTGRTFAITYDMTSAPTNTLFSSLTNDWNLLVNSMHVTSDPRYLHHNGKPVLMVWGLFADRMSANLASQIIAWFESNPTASVTLIGGGEWYWRTETTPGWSNVFRSFDIYSPWNVGNYVTDGTNRYAATNEWSQDIAAATSAGMLYFPVVYPGFSWYNLQLPHTNSNFNLLPRLGGDFLWKQFYDVGLRGLDMTYIAMFDEVDEGTAIFKVTNSPPPQGTFATYEGKPANWYLRLVAEGSKIISGERPNTRTIPIAP